MKIKHILSITTVATLMGLSSCVDGDYDLSDIDTTSRLQTKNLAIPVNIGVLTMENVIELKEGGEVIKDVNENGDTIYAVKKEGTFESDPVKVNSISATPTISSTSKQLDIQTPPIPGDISAYYNIENVDPTTFKINANDIDKSIKRIDTLDITSTLVATLKLEAVGGSIDWTKVYIEDLKIEIPKGLLCTPEKGTFIKGDPSILDLTAEKLPITNKGSYGQVELNLDFYAIDATGRQSDIDYTNRKIAINDQIKISQGRINIYGVSASSLPAKVKFTMTPTIDAINVNKFTGSLEYNVESFSIDPINLKNLPDFLRQEGTKVGLANPQIYLGINNPIGDITNIQRDDYAYFTTGFSLTPERNGVKGTPCTLDDGTMKVGGGTLDEQYFVMSPTKPTKAFPGYTNPSFVKFTSLQNVLNQTDGIPEQITVEAQSPKMPTQDVRKFPVGKDFGTVKGKYAFYSAFQLTAGSYITYRDTVDGWNDKDVDAITINNLVLDLDISTEAAFDVDVTLQPLTLNGKIISGVTPATITVPAKSTDKHFTATFVGTITHLDGILFTAVIQNSDPNTPISPTLKLYTKNTKATITGYYEKEL